MDPDICFPTSEVPYEQIVPIEQKRLLAFVNFWLGRTTDFLLKFAASAETKIVTVERRLGRLENSLILLERKLDSVPSLSDIDVNEPADAKASADGPFNSEPIATVAEVNRAEEPAQLTEQPAVTTMARADGEPHPVDFSVDGTPVQHDSRYEKYFKMLKMGVPSMAVKQKLMTDGLDPNLLDTPNAVAPPKAEGADSTTSIASSDNDDKQSLGDSSDDGDA